MTLTEILIKAGKTEDQITQIYCGKDHWCRCGCGGNYHYPNERGFKSAITKMNKPDFYCFDVDIATDKGYEWINIPTSDDGPGRCYTIYFDKR